MNIYFLPMKTEVKAIRKCNCGITQRIEVKMPNKKRIAIKYSYIKNSKQKLAEIK